MNPVSNIGAAEKQGVSMRHWYFPGVLANLNPSKFLIKLHARTPSFGMLPVNELDALACLSLSEKSNDTLHSFKRLVLGKKLSRPCSALLKHYSLLIFSKFSSINSNLSLSLTHLFLSILLRKRWTISKFSCSGSLLGLLGGSSDW